MARKKKKGVEGSAAEEKSESRTEALREGDIPRLNPDHELEYHADQLMHHAMKRSRGYKAARKQIITSAKRSARAEGFKPFRKGVTKF